MKAIIYNQACWIYEISNLNIIDEFNELLIQSGFSVLKNIEYEFTPSGYTKVWLLGESHLALHTFPEENVLFVELSSCVENKAKLFWKYLGKWSSDRSKKIHFMQANKYEAL